MMPFKPVNWPKDKPVSMLLCTSMSTPGGPEKDNPNVVIVLIAQDVRALLGTPDSENKKGKFWEYKKNPQRLQIAGVFYRNFMLEDVEPENSTKLAYPLVIAWQTSAPAVAPASPRSSTSRPAPNHDFLNVPIPELVAEALNFSENEMIALDASTSDSAICRATRDCRSCSRTSPAFPRLTRTISLSLSLGLFG